MQNTSQPTRKTNLETIGTFGASRYTAADLQLFRDAETGPVNAALAHCAIVRLAKDMVVEDTFRARLYIVLSGALEVADDNGVMFAEGAPARILPGESVGEQSVLDDATNLAAMTAVEDTELLVIEPDLVWRMIDESNGVARNLLRLLSFRIRAANALLRRRQKLGEFYRQLSLNDGLTGLYNRAWLNDMLPKLVGRARQDGHPLSLLMIDLDHFKKFNDTHGHLAGDGALCAATALIRNLLRPSDFAVRYGGEEILVERLCEKMRNTVVFDDMRVPLPHITGSFGIASLTPGGDERTIVADADAALYRAKAAGRDRICF
jgi:diguanylate cyclase (GGDEF)-like protein